LRYEDVDRTQLTLSRGWTLLTHARVVDLRLGKGARSDSGHHAPDVRRARGNLSANLVVMARGRLETPRLLLNANRKIPAGRRRNFSSKRLEKSGQAAERHSACRGMGRPDVLHLNHHLGLDSHDSRIRTTGVVDPNHRTHDLDNLYLIGAVWPLTY
jgi:choline dehydrogenase-like flavoprotein